MDYAAPDANPALYPIGIHETLTHFGWKICNRPQDLISEAVLTKFWEVTGNKKGVVHQTIKHWLVWNIIWVIYTETISPTLTWLRKDLVSDSFHKDAEGIFIRLETEENDRTILSYIFEK